MQLFMGVTNLRSTSSTKTQPFGIIPPQTQLHQIVNVFFKQEQSLTIYLHPIVHAL
jgi:hypothetical protein